MRDPGLQAERTALAWSRTALGVLANGLIMVRAGLAGQRTGLLVAGMLLLGAAGAIHAFGIKRRTVLTQQARTAGAPAAALLLVAWLAGACGAAGVVAIVLYKIEA